MELLAPAGNFEKLRFALAYGADAVYVGGKDFGLRSFAGNFTADELATAVRYTHERGKKIYVTVNVYPRDEEFARLAEYLRFLAQIEVDAVLVADLGVLMLAKQVAPQLVLHISTQANTVNAAAVNVWQKMGARRVVLARELTKAQIAALRRQTTAELEVFVHGAMCMAYSGRCMLSAYMTGSDANRGECRQPCRWKYAVTEETRPGEFFPIAEDEHGTYIFNAKDLCLLPFIKDLFACGVDSLKIEGRMKTVHYAATVTKVYREAIDAYAAAPDKFAVTQSQFCELAKVSHRRYWGGFFAGEDASDGQIFSSSSYSRTADFVGIVTDYNAATKTATIEQRGKFGVGQTAEVLMPVGSNIPLPITAMFDEQGQAITAAPHARQIVKIPSAAPLLPMSIIRILHDNGTA